MFLSKVALQQSTQAKQELVKVIGNGAYSSHQLIWKLFTDNKARNFLYREEKNLHGQPIYYVLSNSEPIKNNVLFDLQCKNFSPKLIEGQRLAYQLRVNPTIAIKDQQGKSRRHDVMMHAKRKAKSDGVKANEELQKIMDNSVHQWFSNEKRLSQWGISLDALPDIQSSQQHKSIKSKTNKIEFTSVDLQGLLTVTNPVLFLEALHKGFGRSRSMGCGLMLIRRS